MAGARVRRRGHQHVHDRVSMARERNARCAMARRRMVLAHDRPHAAAGSGGMETDRPVWGNSRALLSLPLRVMARDDGRLFGRVVAAHRFTCYPYKSRRCPLAVIIRT